MNTLVQILNNKVTTTSLIVAEYFQKDHAKILRDIRSIIDEDTQANFGLSQYKDDSGKTNPCYIIDKDGFTLLAMGFTGKKAMKFKKDYIQAFNVMEAQLQSPKQLSTLEMLKLAVTELEAKEKEIKHLASNNALLAAQDLEVKTAKEYKWKAQVVQANRGRSINYYVSKYFFNGDYREAHNNAKLAYKESTGICLPSKADLMSMEQKKDYLDWLSKYVDTQ